MNIGGRPQNKSARAQIKIAFVTLIISPAKNPSQKNFWMRTGDYPLFGGHFSKIN